MFTVYTYIILLNYNIIDTTLFNNLNFFLNRVIDYHDKIENIFQNQTKALFWASLLLTGWVINKNATLKIA